MTTKSYAQRLTDALFALYNSSPAGDALRAATGGLWPTGGAPQSASEPFMTYELISSASEWTMASDIDLPLVQFNAWSIKLDNEEALAIMQLACALYGDNLISLTDYYTVRADKIGERCLRDPDKGWQGIIEFRYYLQTAR